MQLSQHLIEFLPQRRSPILNTERLALDLETVMNGGRLNPALVNRSLGSAQSILRLTGVPQAGIQSVVSDMRSIGSGGLAVNQPGLIR
jgi:hypothetical protein